MGLGAPNSCWKASGSGLPVPKGITGNLLSQAIAIRAGGEAEKLRMGQVRRTWGAHKDLQVGEAMSEKHSLLAGL